MVTERNISQALEQRCREYNERCTRYPYNSWSVARELQNEFGDIARAVVDESNGEGCLTIESRRSSPLLASLWVNPPAINLSNPPTNEYIHRLHSILIGERRIISRGPLHAQLSYETPLLNVNLNGEQEFLSLLAGRGIFIGAESRMRIWRNIIYEVSMYSLQGAGLNASQREPNQEPRELQQLSNGMAGREQNSEPLQEQDDEGNERFGMLEFD